MTIKLVHTDNAPVEKAHIARILVMGPAARAIAGALLRLESRAEICAADTAADAVEFLNSGEFDHLLVDNRADGAMALTIPRLAAMESVGRLTVLAGPQSSDVIANVPGVAQVISAPYNPIDIARSLGIEVTDSRSTQNEDTNLGRRQADAAKVELPGEVTGASVDEPEEDMRPVFIRGLSALAHFIPGLTPVLSMVYKNLALTLLTCLFVAFISYGVMIAYFLVSGDWSSPLQLQRGHELVIKAERERGELMVKRNLMFRQLTDADAKKKRGENAIERANILSQIVGSTIQQEISNFYETRDAVKDEIETLSSIVESYGSSKSRRAERNRIADAYKRRVITRDYYQRTILSFAKTEENIANLRQRISEKKRTMRLDEQSVTYLQQLEQQLNGGKNIQISVNGKAALVPIANQVIEVSQMRAAGEADLADIENTRASLEHSIEVLSGSIKELESTPMIRALEKPVNVLFVPYDNLKAYRKDEKLFTCAFAIFWCSPVGTVGNPIGGEITTTHPFFGKPIRGQFVEANLTEISAAQKEIIHVGRPPLFF